MASGRSHASRALGLARGSRHQQVVQGARQLLRAAHSPATNLNLSAHLCRTLHPFAFPNPCTAGPGTPSDMQGSSLPALLRGIAPALGRQHAAAPALSLTAWFSRRSASTPAAGSPDPFTEQLQHKTEQELLELLEKGRLGVAEAQEEEGDADQAGHAQVGRAAQPPALAALRSERAAGQHPKWTPAGHCDRCRGARRALQGRLGAPRAQSRPALVSA